MMEITPRLVFLILFITGLAAFLYYDRKKIQRHYILFYRRTKRGIDLIDDIAKKAPRFWNYYGWAGVVTGFISVVGSTYLIGKVMVDMVMTRSAEAGPSLLLPGLVSQNQFQAGVSFVPVEYWIVSVGILMVVHEMSHGIVARREGFELNSVGWIVMGILPGAFVEPKGEKMLPGNGDLEVDEEEEHTGMWDQGSWTSRLKVLGAGSFANYLTAAVFLLLALGLTGAVTQSSVYYSAQDGYPAHDAGMRNGTLYQVEGVPINSAADLQRVSGNISVGENVSLWTSEGNFTVTAVEKEGFEGGYIGIRVAEYNMPKQGYDSYQAGLQWFISLLWTVGLLNFMIGLFNMLPIKPLDGGQMMDAVIGHYNEDLLPYLDRFSGLGWLILITAIILAIVGF